MQWGKSDQSGVSAGRRLAGRGTCAKAGATWEASELGATFLYVTHDQVEAMSMGDKIGMLNKGRGFISRLSDDAIVAMLEPPAGIFVAKRMRKKVN